MRSGLSGASPKRLLGIMIAALTLASAGASAQFQVHYKVSGLTQVPQGTAFTAHTFTNCGKAGRIGPSFEQCLAEYQGAELLKPEYSFAVVNGIQEWVVPATGNYRITARGAQGANHGAGIRGGYGAELTGEFQLVSGQKLKILVGQQGMARYGKGDNDGTGGGGGGSFVALADNTPLIVAGGGGASNVAGTGNADALITTSGAPGSGTAGQGGINGGGGGGALAGAAGNGSTPGGTGYSCSYGSGGGGYYSRGGYNCDGNAPLLAGSSFVSGGLGGPADTAKGGVEGGFGGGAGVGHRAPGGGGYSGGGGDGGQGGGGGGGSYNGGANPSGKAGSNAGHGSVVIEKMN